MHALPNSVKQSKHMYILGLHILDILHLSYIFTFKSREMSSHTHHLKISTFICQPHILPAGMQLKAPKLIKPDLSASISILSEAVRRPTFFPYVMSYVMYIFRISDGLPSLAEHFCWWLELGLKDHLLNALDVSCITLICMSSFLIVDGVGPAQTPGYCGYIMKVAKGPIASHSDDNFPTAKGFFFCLPQKKKTSADFDKTPDVDETNAICFR